MSTLTEYFAKKSKTPKYLIGDRVFGKFGKIPFVGTIGNESSVNPEQVAMCSVHLELPIVIDGVPTFYISIESKKLKSLSVISD